MNKAIIMGRLTKDIAIRNADTDKRVYCQLESGQRSQGAESFHGHNQKNCLINYF